MAPMAGITDLPFRKLCRDFGASLAVSEMVHSNEDLWHSEKSQTRSLHHDDESPISIQIVGNNPYDLANVAAYQESLGADIIDINMGCPAKKVCKKAAGSALLADESLVEEILLAVINAVKIPVTLKIRTGINDNSKNAVTIAKIAEDAGIQALTIHGRTKEQAFTGFAEYDTIAAVKQAVSIPIIANGDIDSYEKAEFVFKKTNADAIMIGRAALGNPWIFKELHAKMKIFPSITELYSVMKSHLFGIYSLYGDEKGVRIARKHITWYLKNFDLSLSAEQKTQLMSTNNPQHQFDILTDFFSQQPLTA